MTTYVTQTQAIAAVAGLTLPRLLAFLEADLIAPFLLDDAPIYRTMDLARLQLLCELADHFDLEGDALGVVIGLIDQLHTSRHRLHAMARAIEAEPQDLRQRVGARFVGYLAM